MQKHTNFKINGKNFTAVPNESENTQVTSLLVDFIRNEAGLKGTKYMCREGGCGACVVVGKHKDATTGKFVTCSLNSCLKPVLSCDGWRFQTIEALGNCKKGYHPLQKAIAENNGTQCGYCTPGFVMTMHGHLNSESNSNVKDIEDCCLDGNICRCTGFRPILGAFKGYVKDGAKIEETEWAISEEFDNEVTLASNLDRTPELIPKMELGKAVRLSHGGIWIKPVNLAHLLEIIGYLTVENIQYRLVAGNTATGVFKDEGPYKVYVDINQITELKLLKVEQQELLIGSAVTIDCAIKYLEKLEGEFLTGFEYSAILAKHWSRIANIHVRNVGTVGGNLMTKHTHPNFPSDLFVTLQGLGATITTMHYTGTKTTMLMEEFLQYPMQGLLILQIHCPSRPASRGYIFRSFKIAERYQNSRATINGAFLFKLKENINRNLLIVNGKPRIYFSGIEQQISQFGNAVNTETFLINKSINDETVLQNALKILTEELTLKITLPDNQYLKYLARNLFYKAVLGFIGSSSFAAKLNPKYVSGGLDIKHKGISSKQIYTQDGVDQLEWPLSETPHKLESLIQASGEALYVNDIPKQPRELFGALLLSKTGPAKLKSIDASGAKTVHGFVRLITVDDIPGKNIFDLVDMPNLQLFSSAGNITSAGQLLGLVLAESQDAAYEALNKIKVTFEKRAQPILTIQDAIENNQTINYTTKNLNRDNSVESTNQQPKHNLTGQINTGSQYHFYLEPQVCLTIPVEDGKLRLSSSTQTPNSVQVAVSQMLGIKCNKIDVHVPRVGGGFGGKLSNATLIACASALGAWVTRKPVRVVLDIETDMELCGKREIYRMDYEVGFDDNGKIQSLILKGIVTTGSQHINMIDNPFWLGLQNIYKAINWSMYVGYVKTDTRPSAFARGPGLSQALRTIEEIIHHIAHFLKKTPGEIRMANLLENGDQLLGVKIPVTTELYPNCSARAFNGQEFLQKLLSKLKEADYESRILAAKEFNNNNRWVKRGMSWVPFRCSHYYLNYQFSAFVGVCYQDGTVIVSHGGIEMGHGINTKVAQVVAGTFGIPLNYIQIKETQSQASLNSSPTAYGSSSVISGVVKASCDIIKQRMTPIKLALGEEASWKDVVKECQLKEIDLRATVQSQPLAEVGEQDKYDWSGYCLGLTETEIDILTGEFKIIRADIFVDCGKVLNPFIDIGQIEGAFVMGIGLWTTEDISYDKETGRLLTNNTWTYKVPMTKNIPEDFRVSIMSELKNRFKYFGGKPIGEIAISLASSVVFSLQDALYSARNDTGNFEYFQMNTPVGIKSILKNSLTKIEQLCLY